VYWRKWGCKIASIETSIIIFMLPYAVSMWFCILFSVHLEKCSGGGIVITLCVVLVVVCIFSFSHFNYFFQTTGQLKPKMLLEWSSTFYIIFVPLIYSRCCKANYASCWLQFFFSQKPHGNGIVNVA
jgi:hypothetical protein